MKKLFSLVLAIYMSFSFTACTDTPQQEQPPEPPGYIIENNTGVKDLSQQQIDCLNNSISDITLQSIINSEKLVMLEKKGTDIALSEVEKIDNDNIRLHFTLTKDGKTLPLSADGIMTYTPGTPNFGNESRMANLDIYWGNISVSNTEIIFSTLNGVQFYSIETFEQLDKTLDFSFTDTEWYLLDTIACDKGYTAAIVSENAQSFVVFDTEGKLADKFDLKKADRLFSYLGYIGRDEMNNNHRNIPIYLLSNVNIKWLDKQQTLLAIESMWAGIDHKMQFIYDAAADMLYSGSICVDFTQDNYGVQLIRTGIQGGAYGDYSDPIPWIALRTENDKILDCFTFTSEELDTTYAEQEFKVKADRLCSLVQVECIENAIAMEISFINKTVTISRMEDQLEMENEIATYATGEYTLYTVASNGGGDVSYHQVILKNNVNGKTKYLDTIGGMYGGNSDAGFMSNGEAYILTPDYFKIFDMDMNNPDPIFTLGEKFPFGSNIDDTVDNRILLAARRDPVAYTYLAIYIEQPYYPDYKSQFYNNDEFDLRLKDTYKVGYFNFEGNLVREYDTGVNAVVAMGYAPVNMYLSQGTQLTFWSWFKHRDNVYNRGTLDLETGVYTSEFNAFE